MGETPQIDRVAGACCYIAGVLFPIIYLSTEPYKSDRFVRFHACQSIVLFIVAFVVEFAPFVPGVIRGIFFAVFFLVWVFVMVSAYRGRTLQIPIIGHLAERLCGRALV